MKTTITLLFLVINFYGLFAQTKKYNLPKSINLENVNITFQKVSVASTSYYINYKVENTGNGVLLLDRTKTKLLQNEGEVTPTSQLTVLLPTKNKVIYNQFRIKAPIQKNASTFKLQLDGVQYASKAVKALSVAKFPLEEKATQSLEGFSTKVMEYNVRSEENRIFAEIKCTFNGTGKQLGHIDLSKVKVNGGKAEIVKKGDYLQAGKSYTFAINITPNGEDVSVDWAEALSILDIKTISIAPIEIKSTDYVESKEAKEKEDEKKDEKKEDCSLSYADFSKLKKDIQKEMNVSNKAVEMANEFLLEKGCINVDQVIEFMTVFNLDGQRLAFAKMAYQFTSDKAKYHNVVGKLSYTKNKEALEEFLSVQ